jgi:KUP system potassium uptake protein
MNWGLMAACIGLVLAFRESARLASAYGIAVSGTMAITSIVFFEVTRATWKWPAARSVALLVLFLSFDIPLFVANLTKFVDGGYVPIFVAAAFFVIMVDWRRGRMLLRSYIERRSESLHDFIGSLETKGVRRVSGTAIYLTAVYGVPPVLAMQAARLRAIMEQVILLTVVIEHEPQVGEEKRGEIQSTDSHGFLRIVLHFGYMENPAVPAVLAGTLQRKGIEIPLGDATYYWRAIRSSPPREGRWGRFSAACVGAQSR